MANPSDYCDACILNSPRLCPKHRPPQFIRNNIAYNSEEEMNLAAVIPGVYLDRWNDAGYVAEAILGSEWLPERDRELRAEAWSEGLHAGYRHVDRLEAADAAGQGVMIPDPVNPYAAPSTTGQENER